MTKKHHDGPIDEPIPEPPAPPPLITAAAGWMRFQAGVSGQAPRQEHVVLAAWALCSAVLVTRYASIRHNERTSVGAALRTVHVRRPGSGASALGWLVQELLCVAEEDDTGPLIAPGGFASPAGLCAALTWFRCGLYAGADFYEVPPAVRSALDRMLDDDGRIQNPLANTHSVAFAMPAYTELSALVPAVLDEQLVPREGLAITPLARALVVDAPRHMPASHPASPRPRGPIVQWMRAVQARARDDGAWRPRHANGLRPVHLAIDEDAHVELRRFATARETRGRTLPARLAPLLAFSADKARRLALVHALASDPDADVVQVQDARYATAYVQALDHALLDRALTLSRRDAPTVSMTTEGAAHS